MFRLFKNEISNIFGGQFWPAWIWTQIGNPDQLTHLNPDPEH